LGSASNIGQTEAFGEEMHVDYFRGNVSFAPTTHTLSGQVTVAGNTTQLFSLAGDGPDPPFISNPRPTGQQTGAQSTLSVDINDTDFPVGDTVTVQFRANGAKVGTDSLTQNGTATVSHSFPQSGTHTWSVVATDSGGLQRFANYSVAYPTSLILRNESDPNQKINASANVTAQFFAGPEVTRTNVQGPNIDLLNAPPRDPVYIELDVDGYRQRTVALKSIFRQNTAFLIPTPNKTGTNRTIDTVNVSFQVQDRTGVFGADDNATILLQRALEINGSTEFRTVVGDRLDVEAEFTPELVADERYRMLIFNDKGDQRVVGIYRARFSESVTVEIGGADFEVEEVNGTEYGAVYENDSGQQQIRARLTVPQFGFHAIKIAQHPDGSNETFSTIVTGGNVTVTETLNATEARTRLPMKVTFTTDVFFPSQSQTFSVVVGRTSYPVVPDLSQLWRSVLGIGLILMLGGIFGGVKSELGAVIVAVFGGILWFIGWLPAAVGGGAVVLALVIGVLAYARDAGEVPA